MIRELLMYLANWAWVPLVLYGIFWAYRQYVDHHSVTANVPTVRASEFEDFGKALIYGSGRYKEGFQIRTDNENIVVLPIELFPETEKYGQEIFSLLADVRDRFLGKWTHVGLDRPAVIETVRMELTRNVDRMLASGIIADETKHALDTEIGPCENWTPIPVYLKLLNSVSMISGRIFVGLPLCRDKEWIDISTRYTVNAARTANECGQWNPLVRAVVAPFLPSVKKCREQQRKMEVWMRPLLAEVQSRRRDEKLGSEGPSGRGIVDLESRGAFVSWLANHLPDSMCTEHELSIGQIFMSFAAIHTTSSATSMALYDLACRPGLVELLREEIDQVAQQDQLKGSEDGVTIWPKQSMVKLWKLDSFLKESQRMNPLAFSTPVRRVLRPVTFSNGLHVPKNARVVFNSWAIHNSDATETFSSAYNEGTGNKPPGEFDALRFYRLRSINGRERKHSVVTTSCESLSFGHGRHACPGRFFAAYEIKSILMAIIQKYDIRLQDDEEGVGGVEKRPKNINFGISVQPNPRGILEFRRRRV